MKKPYNHCWALVQMEDNMKRNILAYWRTTGFSCVLLVSFLVGLFGCVTDSTVKQQAMGSTKHLNMFVERNFSKRIYKDPDKDLSIFRTYVHKYTNTNNPLLEKELFQMLDAALLPKGIQKDTKNPELTVRMTFQTVAVQGVTPVKYLHHITIEFLDHANIEDGKEPGIPPLIYRGEISTVGDSSDIRDLAQNMFDFLLSGGEKYQIVLYFNNVRIDCVYKGESLLVTSTTGTLHKGDIIRKLGGLAPARFIENTINGSFPDPIRKASRSLRQEGGKMVEIDRWWYEFDGDTVVLEVECPQEGTTKNF